MIRFSRIVPTLLLTLAVGLTSTGQARAQWGYGGWGWRGWGGGQTPAGAYLNGMGRYAMGAGIYNYDTALATQLNAQTFMSLNEYWASVARRAAFEHHAKVHQEFLKNKTLYDQHIQKLRDQPTPQQIANGDALNQALTDLSDPRIGNSSLRAANAPIDAKTIAEVPFVNSSERVTLLLDELRQAFNWPDVFNDDARFASDKKVFDEVIKRMHKEDLEGDVSPKTIREAQNLLTNLRAKLRTKPLADEDKQREAEKFVNAFTALLGLLNKPDIRATLAQLREVKNTTVGSLLGFMHAYNLRFAPAKNLKERQLYQRLYETLARTRDQILAEANIDLNNQPSNHPKVITDFYGRIRLKDESLGTEGGD